MDFLTEQEADSLASIAATNSKHGPLTHEEVDSVLFWAREVRAKCFVLDMILTGEVVLTWDRDKHTVSLWPVRAQDLA